MESKLRDRGREADAEEDRPRSVTQVLALDEPMM